MDWPNPLMPWLDPLGSQSKKLVYYTMAIRNPCLRIAVACLSLSEKSCNIRPTWI